MAYAPVGVLCQLAKAAANTTRTTSAVTMTRTRGSRSTRDPPSGPSSRTVALSARTAPVTPTAEPVRWTSSSARVVNCATSPTWLTVLAVHNRR